jgi:hypothetical protein
MGRNRTTKRDVILEGIDKEIASVKADIATAEAEIEVHRSDLSSLYAVEHALEKLRRQTAESLTPQPRQSTTKSNGGTSRASKDSPSRGKDQCAHEYPDNRFCGQPNTDPIHAEDNDDVFAHAFITSGARKKSSTKKHAGLPRCRHEYPNHTICRESESDAIHAEGAPYVLAHPFVGDAASAQQSSPVNGAGDSITPNSGTLPEGVSSVALEASRGD